MAGDRPGPPRLTDEFLQEMADLYEECGQNQYELAARVDKARSTVQNWLRHIKIRGIQPSATAIAKGAEGVTPQSERWGRVIDALRKKPATLNEIAESLNTTRGAVLDAIDRLREQGVNVHEINGLWSVETTHQPSFVTGLAHTIQSDENGKYRFGLVSDTHLGSKYERLDVLNDLYNRFERDGIRHVYHCGNWIDGESRFNKYDLNVYGMDNQCRYLAENYPQKEGITTYAVTGDDHEGWYAQREGVDIGRYLENVMRQAGRTDWVNLGYMEAHIGMEHKRSGATARMAITHPGGGSAYADSYVVQKVLESLEGGEKPQIWCGGHYHKMLAGEYRNVWFLLVPCTKDQDPFARKKRLRYVIGGYIVECDQDEATGAIYEMAPRMLRYFNKGFYEGRWSHHGPVTLPERGQK